MQIRAFKTHKVTVGEDLFSILDQWLPTLQEGDVVAVTSKIISLCEGCIVEKVSTLSKRVLEEKEADAILPLHYTGKHGHSLTLIHNLLLPSAGIDESNGENVYILYPRDIQSSVNQIWQYLRKRDALKELGVIITDSHTTPLRLGVTGIALAWCGFEATYSYVNKPDIFGRPLKFTQINLLDALAASAVLVMGEGDEQTPLVLIQQAPKLIFQDHPPFVDELSQITIAIEDDLYAPLLTSVNWIWQKK